VLAAGLALQAAPSAPVSAAPAALERPVHHLFQNLGRDLLRLPTRDTALTLGLGAAGAFAARAGDDDVSNWALANGESSYTPIGGVLGDAWVQSSAALATYGVGLIGNNRRIVHLGSDLIRGQALNGVLTRGLKLAASRTRPHGGGHSFPSGHTSAAFTSAAVLHEHYGAKVGLPAFAMAGFIGWTRVRDDRHWLTDVIVGAAIGAAAGRTVTIGHRDSAWTIVPAATPQGAGVYVVR
jgi:membrane-associated phospholipid phosphatase